MKPQYHLRQTVVVTKNESGNDNIDSALIKMLSGNAFFFGEIAAIISNDQLCIRRFDFNIPLGTDVTELKWIDLQSGGYQVTPITLPFCHPQAPIT